MLFAICSADRGKTRPDREPHKSGEGTILNSGMAHISGFERDQLLLLPEAGRRSMSALRQSPSGSIDAFVQWPSTSSRRAFARVQSPRATGRPGYAPGDLLKLYIYGYSEPPSVRAAGLRAECPPQHRGASGCCGRSEAGLQDPSPIFAPTIASRSRRCFAHSPCCASGSTCSAGSCWPWTARGSRRSTTRIATSLAIRWRLSSRPPMSGWRITSSASTRATRPKRRRAARE